MGCVSIPFRRLPHQPRLFVQFIDDFSRVANFYAHEPSFDSVKQVAQTLEYPSDRRKEVVGVLRDVNRGFGAGEATLRNLDRLESGAVAIVSGQQVGLFGGPAYAFYKALSAIRWAEELSESGIPAVPVFWMATEDHDLDEVRHVSWFERGKLTRFELAAEGAAGGPVGRVKLGAAIEEMARNAAAMLSGAGSESVAKMLVESYRPEETYGSAFGKLFAQVFAAQGLILLDPLEPRLHRIAAPVYRKALEDRDELNEKLLERSKELETAGFDPQVKVAGKSTLLFRMTRGVREPITAAGNASEGTFKAGTASWKR